MGRHEDTCFVEEVYHNLLVGNMDSVDWCELGSAVLRVNQTPPSDNRLRALQEGAMRETIESILERQGEPVVLYDRQSEDPEEVDPGDSPETYHRFTVQIPRADNPLKVRRIVQLTGNGREAHYALEINYPYQIISPSSASDETHKLASTKEPGACDITFTTPAPTPTSRTQLSIVTGTQYNLNLTSLAEPDMTSLAIGNAAVANLIHRLSEEDDSEHEYLAGVAAHIDALADRFRTPLPQLLTPSTRPLHLAYA